MVLKQSKLFFIALDNISSITLYFSLAVLSTLSNSFKRKFAQLAWLTLCHLRLQFLDRKESPSLQFCCVIHKKFFLSSAIKVFCKFPNKLPKQTLQQLQESPRRLFRCCKNARSSFISVTICRCSVPQSHFARMTFFLFLFVVLLKYHVSSSTVNSLESTCRQSTCLQSTCLQSTRQETNYQKDKLSTVLTS